MALNDTSKLENELRNAGEGYSDLDFNRYLRQANQKLSGMVGRRFVDRQRIVFEDEKLVDLSFNSLENFDKVVNVSDGKEIVDASNYTVNNDDGTVDFDQSYVDDNFFEGLLLKFYYTPSLYKVLELKQAKELVLSHETVVTSDEVTNTQVQRVQETIKNLMKDINSRASAGVQRGDNDNRGTRAPDHATL